MRRNQVAIERPDTSNDRPSNFVDNNHLRYLITLSGKSFPIGGTIPLNLALMPIGKMSIYRLSVILEEKGVLFTLSHCFTV